MRRIHVLTKYFIRNLIFLARLRANLAADFPQDLTTDLTLLGMQASIQQLQSLQLLSSPDPTNSGSSGVTCTPSPEVASAIKPVVLPPPPRAQRATASGSPPAVPRAAGTNTSSSSSLAPYSPQEIQPASGPAVAHNSSSSSLQPVAVTSHPSADFKKPWRASEHGLPIKDRDAANADADWSWYGGAWGYGGGYWGPPPSAWYRSGPPLISEVGGSFGVGGAAVGKPGPYGPGVNAQPGVAAGGKGTGPFLLGKNCGSLKGGQQVIYGPATNQNFGAGANVKGGSLIGSGSNCIPLGGGAATNWGNQGASSDAGLMDWLNLHIPEGAEEAGVTDSTADPLLGEWWDTLNKSSAEVDSAADALFAELGLSGLEGLGGGNLGGLW